MSGLFLLALAGLAGADPPADPAPDEAIPPPAEAPLSDPIAPIEGATPEEVQSPAPAPDPPEPPEPFEGQLPVVVWASPAAWPRAALELGLSGEVLLEIDVTETGQVADARVIEGTGSAFDDLARDSALAFEFEPALDRDRAPVGATIQYRYLFAPGEAPPLSVEGVVLRTGSRRSVEGAIVTARDEAGRRFRTRTDAEGGFRLAGLSTGPAVIKVDGTGLVPTTSEVEVVAGAWKEVVLRVAEEEDFGGHDVDEYIEVYAEIEIEELGAHSLDRATIAELPGALGDPVRALQNLPGVARAPFGSGQLLVRGTGADETGYFIDGMRIPIAFHFTGITTVLNPEILEAVDFYPGGYSVRYGRALGGVVDLRTPASPPELSRTVASVDLLQAAAYTSQRTGRRSSLTLAARRSYLDTILNPVLQATGSGAVRAPRYYDAQVQGTFAVPSGGSLTGLFLLSDDRFRVLGSSDGAATDALGYRTSFAKGSVRWWQPWGRGWSTELAVMTGPEKLSLELDESGEGLADDAGLSGSFTADLPREGQALEESLGAAARVELRRTPVDWWGLRLGADLRRDEHYVVYDFGSDLIVADTHAMSAAYAEPTLRLGPVEWIGGVRYDQLVTDGTLARQVVDRRGQLRLDLGTLRFLAAYGEFSQFPEIRELVEPEIGADLLPQYAVQASVGVEWDPVSGWTFGLTGFDTRLNDLVVGREDVFRFENSGIITPIDDGPFANEGKGRVRGVESLARVQRGGTLGWVATTVSHSVRSRRADEPERPWQYDQPVTLTAVGSQALPRQWRLGGRIRYGSGMPVTPVVQVVDDLRKGGAVPVYGAGLSDRATPFFAADLRVDRTWSMRAWELVTWLEVQNATNHANVELMAWTDDYRAEDPVLGLPVLPAFGVRGIW